MGKKPKEDYGMSLQKAYESWNYLREHGGNDPFYEDGVNMNLVRNHIIYYKRKLEEQNGPFPECYYRKIPPETDMNYVTNSGEIKDLAREAMDAYLDSENLQYLYQAVNYMTREEKKATCIVNVTGYAINLARAIRENDVVTMRRHAYGKENYLSSFAECAEKVRQLQGKVKQEGEGDLTPIPNMKEQSR